MFDKLLIDINEASASGALIHTVYEEKNEPFTVLIRVVGATRNAEDFKYVFYSYLTGLQYGYNQALSYVQNPGTNYPNPSVSFSRSDDLKVKNVFVNDDMTVIDFEYTNSKYANDGTAWVNINLQTAIEIGTKKLTMTRTEGISTSPQKTYLTRDNNKIAFRLYFPPLPEGTKRFDFIETNESPWRMIGIQLD